MKGKSMHTLIGVPQGGIASPILFNIYMNEFDEFIIKTLKEKFEQTNIQENRSIEKNVSKRYTSQMAVTQSLRRKLQRQPKIKNGITKYKNYSTYTQIRNQLRKELNKKRNIKSTSSPQKKTKLYFSYTRYADDWLLLTNANVEETKIIKEQISKWLKENLKLELSIEKTLITDITKKNVSFLGFSFHQYQGQGQIIQTVSAVDRKYPIKRRLNVEFKIGIDHERVRKRLNLQSFIDEKLRPTHIQKYSSLKPWQIVEKCKQKILGFFNYYYYNITEKSELNFYYYIIKTACVKTIAKIQKTSGGRRQILVKYGPNLKISYPVKTLTKQGTEKKTEATIEFISQKQIMTWSQNLMDKQKKLFLKKNTTNNGSVFLSTFVTRREIISSVNVNDIIINPYKTLDPFSTNNINLRTAFKLQNWCCICGSPNSKTNPVQAHHLKHIKKGNITSQDSL
jgi:hypothetical protein